MFIKTLAITHSVELFLWMLGSFLIGYIFAMLYYKKETPQKKTVKQNDEVTNTIQEPEELIIRAKKTVERGGIEIREPKQLNFTTIGKASEEDKNDLTKIKGVGKFIEEKLNKIGIYTYAQIANLSENDMDTITDLIQFFPGRIKRDNWKEQAKQLMTKD